MRTSPPSRCSAGGDNPSREEFYNQLTCFHGDRNNQLLQTRSQVIKELIEC